VDSNEGDPESIDVMIESKVVIGEHHAGICERAVMITNYLIAITSFRISITALPQLESGPRTLRTEPF
jgi:hypothetical protein